MALAEVARDGGGGGADGAQVGLTMLGQRRRDADQDRVGVAQLALVGRAGQPAVIDQALEVGGGDVLDRKSVV